MGLEDVPRCQHVKVNGTQCGSPALRRRRHCYSHDRMLDGKRRFATSRELKPRPVFSIGLLEDANAVQVALMQVLQLLGSGQMDMKMAGLMLYGLQTASANLKNTRFEAEKPTDVVIDRTTVDQTCINGPQWFAREFADAREEGAKQGAAAAVAAGGEGPGEGQLGDVNRDETRRDKSCRDKVRVDRRKRMERAGMDDAPEWVQQVMRGFAEATGKAQARVGAG